MTSLSLPDHLAHAQGVFTICPTPFSADGVVDEASIATLVEFQIEAGVAGLAILGFLGELHKLSGLERQQVIRAFVAQAAGRVPVWVGVRAPVSYTHLRAHET